MAAWFLRKTSANPTAIVSLASPITYLASGGAGYTGNWQVRFKFQLTSASCVVASRGGAGTETSQNILFFSNATTLQIRRANVNTNLTLPVSASAGASVYAITGNAALNNATVTQDGVAVGTISGANLFLLLQDFFAFGNTTRTGDLYWFEFSNDGVVTNYYLNTTGTGQTLVDTVGGNNGTLINFPTNNTQWIRTDAVTRAGSRFCSLNTSTFTSNGAINTPLWIGGNAVWVVEFDVAITSLAATRFLSGPSSGSFGAVQINTNGSILLSSVTSTSVAGTILVNTRYNIKVESLGTTKNVYVKLDSDPSYGAAVCTGTNTGNILYSHIGRVSATYGRCFDVYGFSTLGGTYSETWDGTNAPSTGTTWTGVNGGALTLVNTQGTADAWWILYNSITQTHPLTSLSAAVGTPTSINLNAYFSGATAYQIYSGALPQGLIIVGNSIVGTATQAGTVTCVIRAYNDYDTLDSGVVSFVVEAGGGVVPFTGTLTKLSLSISNKSLQTQLGQSLSLSKDTLTLSNKSLQTSAGYVNILAKQEITQDNKQLSVSSGYVDPLNKESLTLQNKLLSVQAGSAISFVGEIGKLPLSLVGKQLAISAGYNSNVSKQDLIVDGKSNDILAGFNATLSEQSLTLTNKQLTLVTGTAISFVGELGKSALNISNKLLDVTTGTAIPYQGVLQKTSLSISYKLLDTTRGYISTLQKEALELVGKDLSFGLPTYPIIPIERLFTMKGDDGRTYLMKQTTTVYIMKNKDTTFIMRK